jgi:hypothetical protein
MYKQYISMGKLVTEAIIRTTDGACIPFDPANTDYQAYLKYKEEGGKVYGPDEEVPSGQTSK